MYSGGLEELRLGTGDNVGQEMPERLSFLLSIGRFWLNWTRVRAETFYRTGKEPSPVAWCFLYGVTSPLGVTSQALSWQPPSHRPAQDRRCLEQNQSPL